MRAWMSKVREPLLVGMPVEIDTARLGLLDETGCMPPAAPLS